MAAHVTVHATCLVMHEAGVLIRGESGSGKTSLALALLDRAVASGFHAGLVGDDRIRLESCHGRLVARGHPAVEGLLEIRGYGIRHVTTTHDATVIRLVVDLAAERERLPDTEGETTGILGITLPCLTLGRALMEGSSIEGGLLEGGLAVRIVLDALATRTGCVAARTHQTILTPRPMRDP